MDEAHQLTGFILGGFFVGREAALREIVGYGVTVGATDLHRDCKLLHDAHEFGFGDGGGENGEIGEVVGDVWWLRRCCLCGRCWLLSCKWKAEEEREEGGSG